MRAELSAATLGVLAQRPHAPTVPDSLRDRLIFLAEFVSPARFEVARDRQGVIEYVPAPEVGTRVGKALKKLAMGIAMARGIGTVDEDAYRIVRRVAADTIPSMRARLLHVLWGLRDEHRKTGFVGDLAEIPSHTAKVWLDDLRLLGIVDRGGDQHGGYTYALRKRFESTIAASGLNELWTPHRGVGGGFAPQTPLAPIETGLHDESVPESVRGAESGGTPITQVEVDDEVPF